MELLQSAEQFHKFLEDNKKGDLDRVPSFQDFLELLKENGKEVQEQDLSLMAWYLGGMEFQFNLVLNELRTVKEELAQMTGQQVPTKSALTRMVDTLETKVAQARRQLLAFRDKIMECATDAVDRFKDAGVSALDSAVAAMGAKKGLEHLQEGLQSSISGMKEALTKAEIMGAELRQAGQHLKNAGRTMAGKDVQMVNGGQEGRFQFAVLTPMRATQKLLSNINNNTLAAIGAVEDLEQSADIARGRQSERAAQKPGKRLEKKSSIQQILAEKKAEVIAMVQSIAAKDRKPPEAEL